MELILNVDNKFQYKTVYQLMISFGREQQDKNKIIYFSDGGGGGVGVKADCLNKDLGLKVGCPPWGSF